MSALLCFFLTLLASLFKSKSRPEAENAALRHQLAVLRMACCSSPTQRILVVDLILDRHFEDSFRIVTIEATAASMPPARATISRPGVAFVLEADDEVVGVAHEDHVAPGLRPSPAQSPEVERVV